MQQRALDALLDRLWRGVQTSEARPDVLAFVQRVATDARSLLDAEAEREGR